MGAVVVAPLYVPKPAEETPWLGKPTGVAAVLLAAIATLTVVPLKQPTRQFNHFVDAIWQDINPPVPLVLSLPPSSTPFTNRRQFNYAEEVPGFKSIPFYIPVTPQDVLPFRNVRNFDNVPEPGWLGEPVPILLALTLPPQAVLPFHNTQWKGPIPDPDWVEGGGSIPLVQSQLPALPPFTSKPTRKFDHVPEPFWQGAPKAIPVLFLPGPTVLPFHNYPWQGPIPDPDWIGKPTYSQVVYQLPALPPFTVKGTRQFNHVPEPDWVGKPQPVPFAFVVPLQAPFRNVRLEDFVPEPNPSQPSKPIPQVLQHLPAIPIFTSKGTRIFNVPDDQPWSQHGTHSATIYLPITVLQPLETLKNVIARVRTVHNTTQRVRFITNITSRRKP